jgi:hypothetical protein
MEVMGLISGRKCSWDDESLEEYSRGILPAEESAELEQHLLICESCQARLAQEDAFAASMRQAALRLGRPSPAMQRRIGFFPKLIPTLACAAGLLLLVLAGWRSIRPTASSPAIVVRLEAMRGVAPGSKAPAGRPLSFQADLSGLPAAISYRLELVDRDGRGIWKGTTAGATVPALQPGMYFMRVYSGGELQREYGLEVEAAQPPR